MNLRHSHTPCRAAAAACLVHENRLPSLWPLEQAKEREIRLALRNSILPSRLPPGSPSRGAHFPLPFFSAYKSLFCSFLSLASLSLHSIPGVGDFSFNLVSPVIPRRYYPWAHVARASIPESLASHLLLAPYLCVVFCCLGPRCRKKKDWATQASSPTKFCCPRVVPGGSCVGTLVLRELLL